MSITPSACPVNVGNASPRPRLSLQEALARTKATRDILALNRAAEHLRDLLEAYQHDHDAGTVANELIRAGVITTEQLDDADVWQAIEGAASLNDDIDGFIWSLRMFLVALEAYYPRRELPPLDAPADAVTPCAVVGGKEVA